MTFYTGRALLHQPRLPDNPAQTGLGRLARREEGGFRIADIADIPPGRAPGTPRLRGTPIAERRHMTNRVRAGPRSRRFLVKN